MVRDVINFIQLQDSAKRPIDLLRVRVSYCCKLEIGELPNFVLWTVVHGLLAKLGSIRGENNGPPACLVGIVRIKNVHHNNVFVRYSQDSDTPQWKFFAVLEELSSRHLNVFSVNSIFISVWIFTVNLTTVCKLHFLLSSKGRRNGDERLQVLPFFFL